MRAVAQELSVSLHVLSSNCYDRGGGNLMFAEETWSHSWCLRMNIYKDEGKRLYIFIYKGGFKSRNGPYSLRGTVHTGFQIGHSNPLFVFLNLWTF